MVEFQDIIVQFLENQKIIFNKENGTFHTFWRLNKRDFVISVSKIHDWLNFTCILPLNKLKISKDNILGFNNRFFGLKMILSKDDSLAIAFQVPVESILSLDIKKCFLNILNAINDLNFD
jgi:hypothetical protein